MTRFLILSTLTAVLCSCGGSGTVTFNFINGAAVRHEGAGVRGAGDFGESTVGASGLSSVKYYVSSIQICNDLTINGSGYSNPQGCSRLYTNEADDYESFLYDAALAAGATKYIDLLVPAEIGKLTAAPEVDEGVYNYGIINWYRPVKFTGSITDKNGGVTYRTKTGGTFNATTEKTTVGDLTSGTVGESVVVLPNGGTYFRFQSPFTVAAGESYELDLAFNLNGAVKAGPNATNASLVDGASNGILFPLLNVAPIPRTAGEKTKVETYVLTGQAKFNLRLELFYRGSDTEKTVLGAVLTSLYTAATDSLLNGVLKIKSLTVSGEEYTFVGDSGETLLSGFTRSETAAGTATYQCSQAECGADGPVTLNYNAATVSDLE